MTTLKVVGFIGVFLIGEFAFLHFGLHPLLAFVYITRKSAGSILANTPVPGVSGWDMLGAEKKTRKHQGYS